METKITLPKDAEGRKMRLIDPKGRVRKVHYVPNINGFGARAWVRIGPFKKIENVAAGDNAIDNLVKRLEADGWKVAIK